MTNRALLVGINAYPGNELNGCINDVQGMAEFLTSSMGFATSDIRLLCDDRATTSAITERLGWLVQGATNGDRLVLHYSGHGALLPLRDGSGAVTSVHDTICPVDFDFSPEHAITDDDFRGIFQSIQPGVHFAWVSDSCHSGDLARELRQGPPTRPRLFPMPADIAWRLRDANQKGLASTGFPKAIEHLKGALISGCRSDQTSADAFIQGSYHGALTYYLLQELTAGGGLTATLSTVVADVNRALLKDGYSQQPQLRGDPAAAKLPLLATGAAASRTRRITTTAPPTTPKPSLPSQCVELKFSQVPGGNPGALIGQAVQQALAESTGLSVVCDLSGSLQAANGVLTGSVSIVTNP
jgi:hypothetical protein